MIQAYQGYFLEDGRFVTNNAVVKIPPNRLVIINVLEEIIATKTTPREDAIAKRLKMVESITGIISPEVDVDAIRAERITKRGLL